MSQVEAESMEAQLLATMLGSWDNAPVAPEMERRAGERSNYPYMQYVAPVLEGELPTASDLTKVRCHDISSGGFSFITHVLPVFESVVVGFGTLPNMLYLQAEVIHVTPRADAKKESYVVGCRYVGKVRLEE